MAQLRSFSSDEIHRLAPMPAAIAALRECFAARPSHIPRTVAPASGGELMIMPAVDGDAAGIKLLMVQPKNLERGLLNIQGTYVLFDADMGRPVALLDGAALTNIRTPGVSAVATDALARADARSLGIIGTGPQAIAHVEAMLAVRPGIDSITVASRTRDKAEGVATDIAASGVTGGVGVRAGSWADAAACDIVCTATRAIEPILTLDMVRPGTHINAIGAYRPDMRELAADLVAASIVTVDDVAAGHEEAGDLILAVAEGVWSWDRLAGDLAAVARGEVRRTNADEITFFKSSGLAVEDLVIARLVADSEDLLGQLPLQP